MAELLIRHHSGGHLSFSLDAQTRLDVDPRKRRRRRLNTDYVLLTTDNADVYEDALDVLETNDATLVCAPALAQAADRELKLGERAVDLGAFERVRSAHVRVTALPAPPAARASMFSPIGDNLPVNPMEMQFMGVGPRALLQMAMGLPVIGGAVRAGGDMIGAATPPAALQGYTLNFLNGGPTVSILGETLAGRPDRRWLDSLNDAGSPDILMAAAAGSNVEGVVWAVRELKPDAVLLYRVHDPYDGHTDNLPIGRFVDALQEDAPTVEVTHLRSGDGYAVPLSDASNTEAASA